MEKLKQNVNIRITKTIFVLTVMVVFLIPYGLLPYIYVYENSPTITQKLIFISFLVVSGVVLFLVFSKSIKEEEDKKYIDFRFVNRMIFLVFFAVVMIIFITAPSIPIIDAILFGSNGDDLNQSRENFLKTRTGWEQGLNYIIGMLTSYILPYLIAFSHYHKVKSRWKYTFLFFLYCISFLEKAYFLKVVIPLLIIYIVLSKRPLFLAIKGLAMILLMFVFMFSIAGYGESDGTIYNDDFFSMQFAASGTIQKVLWRILVVPVVTAFDALNVFASDFNNNFFNGKTSSLISFFLGEEQLNFERYLYFSQFGGGGFGNSNQFFGIEAYVNFGYSGVFIFAIAVGYFIDKAIRSLDLAYISIMPLLIYNLFNAGLIGNLFSNGYVIFFGLISTFKIVYKKND